MSGCVVVDGEGEGFAVLYPLHATRYTLYTTYMTTVFDDQKQDATLLELRKEEEENLVKILSDKYK